MGLKKILSIEEISNMLSNNAIARTELPIEWELSLPMPTLRLFKPAYVWFANPTERHPGKPLRLFPPDRWFALDASNGQLLDFNAWEAPLKTIKESWHEFDLQISDLKREEAINEFNNLIEVLNYLTLSFFSNQHTMVSKVKVITEYLDPLTLPWYRYIAPDFWNWLESTK